MVDYGLPRQPSIMGVPAPALVRFGVFEADLRAGELRRNGAKVRIQELPFRALTLLLSRPGVVITREEFRQALWPPDVFVDFEQGISTAMMRLRDALGDSADNPIFIQTIERRGYRWIGPIQAPAESPVQAAMRGPIQAPIHPPFGPQETPVAEAPAKELAGRAAVGVPAGQAVSWRKLVLVFPVLALLGAMWMFRGDFRSARANAKPGATAVRPRPAANPEAQELYLKGRFYWNKRTPESLNQAVDAFTQAIVHDPNYSDAYVGLADCYNLLSEFSAMPPSEAFTRSYAAAKKAVELDPQSSEAHASLAFATFWGMWDAEDAEKEFRRAIELDPNNGKAHHWFATFLHARNRHAEAVEEIDIAQNLDPHSSSVLADRGELLYSAGQREEGVALLKQLEAAEPNFVSPHRYLHLIYFERKDFPNYVAELKAEALLTHNQARLAEAEAAAKGLAEGGERGMLVSELKEQKAQYERGGLSPYFVAQSEALLGNSNETLKYLKACVESHDELVLEIYRDPIFFSLHGNAEFEDLVRKVGNRPVS